MTLPVHDWQFWVVTGLFGAAVLWLVRGLLPRARKRRGEKRATLTVEGRTMEGAKGQRGKGAEGRSETARQRDSEAGGSGR